MAGVRRRSKTIREEDSDMPFYDDEDSGGYRSAGYREGGYQGGGPRAAARHHQPPLHTEKLVTDRKIFFLDLKENDRGRVVKITEDVRGRRDTIMLPVDMLRDFIEALQRIEDADAGTGSAAAADEPQAGD
jgi:hypothetical protein